MIVFRLDISLVFEQDQRRCLVRLNLAKRREQSFPKTGIWQGVSLCELWTSPVRGSESRLPISSCSALDAEPGWTGVTAILGSASSAEHKSRGRELCELCCGIKPEPPQKKPLSRVCQSNQGNRKTFAASREKLGQPKGFHTL